MELNKCHTRTSTNPAIKKRKHYMDLIASKSDVIQTTEKLDDNNIVASNEDSNDIKMVKIPNRNYSNKI